MAVDRKIYLDKITIENNNNIQRMYNDIIINNLIRLKRTDDYQPICLRKNVQIFTRNRYNCYTAGYGI